MSPVVAKDARISVKCCYCGSAERAEEPPSLHTCRACKRDFRVYLNRSGGPPMEITKQAKAFFTRDTTEETA